VSISVGGLSELILSMVLGLGEGGGNSHGWGSGYGVRSSGDVGSGSIGSSSIGVSSISGSTVIGRRAVGCGVGCSHRGGVGVAGISANESWLGIGTSEESENNLQK